MNADNEVMVLESACKEISSLITQGIEAWCKAGEIVVEMVDKGYDIGQMANIAGVSKSVLIQFERIGRKSVHPRLLASTSSGAKALARCAYSEQVKYIDQPIDVLLMRENGDTDVLKVAVDALTPDQVAQVIYRGEVRDLAAQRAFIEDRVEKASEASMSTSKFEPLYTIKGKKVFFREGAELSQKDLVKILSEIA